MIPLFALLGLCACHASGGNADFPRTDDPDLSYLQRNGDNFRKSGINHNYDSMCRPFSKKYMEENLKEGKSSLLFLYSDSCAHCREAHGDLTNFFLSSSVEVVGVNFPSGDYHEIYTELTSFVSDYPGLAKTISTPYLTPSIYLIKDEEKALNLQFLNERESLQNLFDFFKGFINFTYVYSFRSYDAFASFYKANDCLVFVDEESEEAPGFFYENLYQEAIHSGKMTAHIEWDYVSESDRTKFASLLPDRVYEAKKGELSPIPFSSLTADWIKSYYA